MISSMYICRLSRSTPRSHVPANGYHPEHISKQNAMFHHGRSSPSLTWSVVLGS